MTERTCSIPGCPDVHCARGWCKDHYNAWHDGRAQFGPSLARSAFRDPEDAFAARTERRGACLVWTGGTTSSGHGQMWVDGRNVSAHRYAWERENGPLATGETLRRACETEGCVLPAHRALRASGTARTPGQACAASVTPSEGGYVAQVGEVYRELFPSFAQAAEATLAALERHPGAS